MSSDLKAEDFYVTEKNGDRDAFGQSEKSDLQNQQEANQNGNGNDDDNESNQKRTRRLEEEAEEEQSLKKSKVVDGSGASASVNPSPSSYVQHLSYEEVTKIAAAQLAATGLAPAYPTTTTPSVEISLPPLSEEQLASIVSSVTPSGDSEIIEVSKEKVGQIIGSRGAIIQEMQTRTGAKLYVKQDIIPCQVQINGTPQQVKAAGDLVRRIILEGPTAIHPNSAVAVQGGASVVLDCPQALVGRVIGSAGSTIRELQTRSGAKIQIDQNFPDGAPRKIQISGSQTAVTLATQLVSYVMENGPALPGQPPLGSGGMGGPMGAMNPYAPAALQPGAQSHVLECAKNMVGRLIGKGGETINLLQQRSGAKMQIDQTVVPCKIQFTGSPQSIAMAVQLVNELIQTGSTSAMSMPAVGGYGMPAATGYPGYAPSAYGAQYGSYGQQYGQYPGYTPGAYGQAPAMGAYGGATAGAYNTANAQGSYGAQGQPAAVAAPIAQKSSLPAPWSEHKTDDGNTYWYNSSTGVSQWERPV